uniref:Thiol oxidase n=1 Tax=Parastrongyloides trichosuri TaxID=131310 RepID=A0A0N4ZTM3_PARTI
MHYSDIDTFSGLDDFSNIQDEFNDDMSSYGSLSSCDDYTQSKEFNNNENECSVMDRQYCPQCREMLAYKYVLKEKCSEELKEWLVQHSDILDTWEATHEGNRRYPLNNYEHDFYELKIKDKINSGYDQNAWDKYKRYFVGNDFREWITDIPNKFYNEGDPQFIQFPSGISSKFNEDRESIKNWILNTLQH